MNNDEKYIILKSEKKSIIADIVSGRYRKHNI